jgi:glycosyltransferase involved in cell wall biosynthesis
MNHLGIVTIGRNEGERLRRCLTSVVGRGLPVVYVDSNSTDGSPALARSLGAEVVELDPSWPVGVPRARNEGFQRLCQIDPDVRFVQFLDGDCELVEGWLERGCRVLGDRPEVALVTGRRRERFPERSIYNRLADLEWDMPIGEINGSHGDIMVRTLAFCQVGGFDAAVLVGEDYELCVRLRKQGWILLRIDAEMTLHDMAMTRFGQWWWRNVRCGYGYADGALVHGKPPERHWVREVRSILFWGVALPGLALAAAWPSRGASLLLLGGYVYLYWRIRRYGSNRRWSAPDAQLYARWCILAKFPHAIGLFTYWFRRLRRSERRIIEYKGVGAAERQHDARFPQISQQGHADGRGSTRHGSRVAEIQAGHEEELTQ